MLFFFFSNFHLYPSVQSIFALAPVTGCLFLSSLLPYSSLAVSSYYIYITQCLADIKVTPNGRFYPGTHERVVLVVGEPGSVQMACDRIVTTIYTAADTSLDITQRVLIPDAASGLIIGHDGVRLGELRQEAGVASIQVCVCVRARFIHTL